MRSSNVDLSGLGPKIIIPEFALAALGAPALGVLTMLRSGSIDVTAFGVALLGIRANYVRLRCASSIARAERTKARLAVILLHGRGWFAAIGIPPELFETHEFLECGRPRPRLRLFGAAPRLTVESRRMSLPTGAPPAS